MASNEKIIPIHSFALASVKTSARKTLAALAESGDPKAFVRTLGTYDLLLAWSLASDEQRVELQRLVDVEQFRSLVDICCWKSDLPDFETLEQLLAPSVLSDVESASLILEQLEPELRTLLLRRFVRVHQLEDPNDSLPISDEAEILSCPDGYYHIELIESESISAVQRALWTALLLQPFEYYHRELECIRHDLPIELEELALHWRNGRLADQGFVSFEESHSLLVPRSAAEVRSVAQKRGLRFHSVPSEAPFILPSLYRERLNGQPFLDDVFELLASATDQESRDAFAALEAGLGCMVNRFLTATRTKLVDMEEVQQRVIFARDLLALGLSEISDNEHSLAAQYLSTLEPASFLQVACSLLYPLRDRARSLLAHKGLSAPGHLGAAFDPPYLITLRCLAQELPSRWPQIDNHNALIAEGYTPIPSELAAFATRKEVDAAERLLSEAEELPTLLTALGCSMPLHAPTPASVLLLTALANAASDKPAKALPLTYQEAMVFGEKAISLAEEDLLEDALQALSPVLGIAADGYNDPEIEPDPLRRLLIRVAHIGLSRLAADAPFRVLLVEN